MGSKSDNSKLFFTSSASSYLLPDFASAGLYSCTIGDFVTNDDDHEDVGGCCTDPQVVADTYGQDMDPPVNMDLPLMNLNFFTPSREDDQQSDFENVTQPSDIDDRKDYLYGATSVEHEVYHINTWELLRAEISKPDEYDGSSRLEFHEYFRTPVEFDFNNCEFDCCPFNDDIDSNGIQAHRDWHDHDYLHAFVRTSPRAYAVDSSTGEIFITWQGFYKNCNPADIFYAPKTLEWTIGISRLKTQEEDPSCILVKQENGKYKGIDDIEQNFSRCTEPVSIVHRGSEGHEVSLPYGGFSIIPAVHSVDENTVSSFRGRRAFLISVLRGTKEGTKNFLWSIPEGGDVTHDLYVRQEITSSMVHSGFQQHIWNGGNQRLHFNQETGRPDRLCHTVFDKGIQCMKIRVTEDLDSIYVAVDGEAETFLTEEQVTSFCAPGRETHLELGQSREKFEKYSTLVTGLDVLWNEKDGSPERIFFGCYGQQSDGRLGSVDRGAENLREMLKGAYAGDVLLLPKQNTGRGFIDSSAILSPSSKGPFKENAVSTGSEEPPNFVPGSVVVLFLIALAGFTRYKLGNSTSSLKPMYTTTSDKTYTENSKGYSPSYMELASLSCSESPSATRPFV